MTDFLLNDLKYYIILLRFTIYWPFVYFKNVIKFARRSCKLTKILNLNDITSCSFK